MDYTKPLSYQKDLSGTLECPQCKQVLEYYSLQAHVFCDCGMVADRTVLWTWRDERDEP